MKANMSKKLMAAALTVAMAIPMITGCGAQTAAPAGDVADAGSKDSAAKSNVTLTVMAPQDHIKEVEQFELAEKFKEETGITIDFQISPADQFDSLLSTKLNSGTCADIFSA